MLTGTPKQVTWAESIRNNTTCNRGSVWMLAQQLTKGQGVVRTHQEIMDRLVELLPTEARWWIDNRDYTGPLTTGHQVNDITQSAIIKHLGTLSPETRQGLDAWLRGQ